MPTGRLRKGFVRIAGVVSEEVFHELARFMIDRGYATLSKALGAYLQECLEMRRAGVSHPAEPPAGREGDPQAPAGVVHPADSRHGEG